jgi:hypothetical protein
MMTYPYNERLQGRRSMKKRNKGAEIIVLGEL